MNFKQLGLIALLFLSLIMKAWSQQIHTAIKNAPIKKIIGESIEVPIVYGNPSMGKAKLTLDFGAPFNRNLPTVIVVADGQQFYVQKDAMKALQANTFGNSVNVVGIITRGTTDAFINASINKQNKPDWLKAWQIFNSNEWIEDIESVRKALVGNNGSIYLYGRSGGAYLVHQYLSKYVKHVAKAFTQSSVNPYINKELGIGLDRFWSDLGDQDVHLQTELQKVLLQNPNDRNGILMTLQRQHFFVSADKINDARATLIHKLALGDTAFYHQARKDYEVDEMTVMANSKNIIPQNVRVLELISPSGAFDITNDGRIYPLAETQRNAIQPLIDLQSSGKISLKPFDFVALHQCKTQMFVLAGRYDEAVDYRTNIALASEYPVHELFIANDNHVFSNLTASGTSKKIIGTFYAFGIGTRALNKTLANAQEYRWMEK